MTPAEHTLRQALRSMLDDLTFPEAQKGRAWIEDRLREPGWTAAQRWQLVRYALAWARTTDATEAAALWKALGEESTGHQTQDDPGDRGLDLARPEPLSTTTDIVQDRERITTMATTVNSIDFPHVATLENEMDRMTPAEEEKLTTALAKMREQPQYWTPQNTTRLERAERLYREGKVTCDQFGIYHVKGSDQTYDIGETCPCKDGQRSQSKWCAHLIATALHRKLHAPMQNEPSLFTAPRTVEERLAAPPQETAQEAPSGPVEASTAQDVAVVVLAPETLPEAPSAPEVAALPRLTLQLPRRSINAIVADLSKPIPPQCWAQIPAVGKRPAQDYLPWHTVAAILDTYAPGWEGEITRVDKLNDRDTPTTGEVVVPRLSVTYRLTIHAAEGLFHQEDAGEEDEDKDDYGGPMAAAIATAMKRCAAKFGVGRVQGYDKQKKTAAFLDHVRGERLKGLEELGKLLDERAVSRGDTLAWLKTETGAGRNDQIPLWAIRAVMQQLSTPTLVSGVPTHD